MEHFQMIDFLMGSFISVIVLGMLWFVYTEFSPDKKAEIFIKKVYFCFLCIVSSVVGLIMLSLSFKVLWTVML